MIGSSFRVAFGNKFTGGTVFTRMMTVLVKLYALYFLKKRKMRAFRNKTPKKPKKKFALRAACIFIGVYCARLRSSARARAVTRTEESIAVGLTLNDLGEYSIPVFKIVKQFDNYSVQRGMISVS